jgi:hypothetical protein
VELLASCHPCPHAMQTKAEAPEAVAARQRAAAEAAEAESAAVVHEDNEWHIEVVPADASPEAPMAAGSGSNSQPRTALPEGLSFSHVGNTIGRATCEACGGS